MNPRTYDAVIIGGGIVGTATAYQLIQKRQISVLILEAESSLAAHQTGNNSGVIHSGLYYKPGSLKAKNCTAGREMMYEFCERYNIKHERCGKIVVASSKDELASLDELEKRGKANGLEGLIRLKSRAELRQYEPYVEGIAGLFVPQTGIVDYTNVTHTIGRVFMEYGGEVHTEARFLSLAQSGGRWVLETTNGEYSAKVLINCAGLHSDRVASACGVDPEIKIIPFRGEYYEIKKEKEHLVRNLIYPVPDPRFPFLGVHFTRMVKGGVEAGPNAVLAFKREGYKWSAVSWNDIAEMITYGGFWKMASKYYKMGIGEFRRSFSKSLFTHSLQKLIPDIRKEDLVRGGAGVRAQALDRNGKLLDDFYILERERMVHVLNAPSPAATSSLSIGNKIAELIVKNHGHEL